MQHSILSIAGEQFDDSEVNMTMRALTDFNHQFAVLLRSAPITRKVVKAGEKLFHAVDPFDRLYVVNTGVCKTVETTPDGREQVVSLHFKGDWLGIGGIAGGRYGCDAIFIDTGEVWSVRYEDLLKAGLRDPEVLTVLHRAMSREVLRDRESMLALCTLPADARVAEFLRWWARALQDRGLRADAVNLPLSRAEIGNFLGMTLESVSRAMTRLERSNVIRFTDHERRAIEIPAMKELGCFVQRCLEGPERRQGAVLH